MSSNKKKKKKRKLLSNGEKTLKYKTLEHSLVSVAGKLKDLLKWMNNMNAKWDG